ncbi:hypothetical protein [Lacinutrix salivirga]
MKIFTNICLSFLALTCFACGSDDDGTTPQPPQESATGIYFPSALNDLWIYNVESTDENNTDNNFSETDVITVSSETDNSFELQANNGTSPANGSMNAILVNGVLTSTDTTLLYNGALELPEELVDFIDQDITLNTILLYDLNAGVNSDLSSLSDTFSETLDLNGTSVPLIINYTFKTTKLGNLNALTVDGTVYDDVIKSKLTLEMDISITVSVLGISQTISLLDTQNVLATDYYFARDIGLIKADAVQGFQLSPAFLAFMEGVGATIPFPTSASVTNIQELDSYVVE